MTATVDDAYVQWARAVNLLLADLLRRVDVELAELRDGVVDLDHRLSETHQLASVVREGHNNLVRDVAALTGRPAA